jgi:HD-GYP domain-containing protein (c-di-GMP phosphodiesterase class II)
VSDRSITMTPKLNALGRSFIVQLHTVLRTLRIHDSSNRAVLIGTENLKDTINTLRAALGGKVKLQFMGGVAYLNDLVLRLDDTSREQAKLLQQELESRGLGGLGFARPVDSAALREFLIAFSRPVSTPEEASKLKQMQVLKDMALELLGQKQIDDDEGILRIDAKTFAVQTYAKAVIAVKEFVLSVQEGRNPLGNKLKITRIMQDLVDVATERVNFLLKLASLKTAESYTFTHAANTCVLSILLGKGLGLGRVELVELGASALLADVGRILLPQGLGMHDGDLTAEEHTVVHEQTVRLVRTIIGEEGLYPAVVRRTLIGYEQRMPARAGTSGQIHLYARIIAVASAFDQFTTSTPWRDGYTADEALRGLLHARERYDPVIVKVLVNMLGIYPVGAAVELGTGEIAVVYHTPNATSAKPWVKVVIDAAGQKMKRPVVRNLEKERGPGGQIVGTVRPARLGDLDPGMVILF